MVSCRVRTPSIWFSGLQKQKKSRRRLICCTCRPSTPMPRKATSHWRLGVRLTVRFTRTTVARFFPWELSVDGVSCTDDLTELRREVHLHEDLPIGSWVSAFWIRQSQRIPSKTSGTLCQASLNRSPVRRSDALLPPSTLPVNSDTWESRVHPSRKRVFTVHGSVLSWIESIRIKCSPGLFSSWMLPGQHLLVIHWLNWMPNCLHALIKFFRSLLIPCEKRLCC